MDNCDIKSGDKAELKFKDWLDKHKIPYLYIQQDLKSFSPIFNETNYGKRPDFIILLKHFGFIFVDIKEKKINPEYKNYCIDEIETKKYSSLQRKFNLQVWFVISNEDYDYKTWLWIPVSKVLESGIKTRISTKSNEGFFPIPLREFIQLSDNDSIDRLFSQIF